MSLLEVNGLDVVLAESDELLLRDVELTLDAGEIRGLVGESGSGKTMASLALLGLLPPGIRLGRGTATIEGRPLLAADGKAVRHPGDITMIFQNPRAALNPTMRVGNQVARVLRYVRGHGREAASTESVELLRRVGIPGAHRVARSYPHQLSGGMCQRAVIAMALAYRPRVLLADEPTTGLDVTVQAQVFDLLRELSTETGCGILFITHDLAAVAEMCDSVTVLYAGQVMETASTTSLFDQPRHPYSTFLLGSLQDEDETGVLDEGSDMSSGVDFSLPGCRFAHRCPHVFEACSQYPPLFDDGSGHHYSCFLGQEGSVVAAQRSRPA